jgi:hypothetical protein
MTYSFIDLHHFVTYFFLLRPTLCGLLYDCDRCIIVTYFDWFISLCDLLFDWSTSLCDLLYDCNLLYDCDFIVIYIIVWPTFFFIVIYIIVGLTGIALVDCDLHYYYLTYFLIATSKHHCETYNIVWPTFWLPLTSLWDLHYSVTYFTLLFNCNLYYWAT